MGAFLTLLINHSFPTLGNLIKKIQNLWNAHPLPALPPHGVYIDRCILLAFKYLAEFFRPFCLNYSWLTEKVSFPLNSSNDALIVFPPCANWPWRRQQFRRRMQKITVDVRWWQSDNHSNLYNKVYVLKMIFKEISIAIYIGIFWVKY